MYALVFKVINISLKIIAKVDEKIKSTCVKKTNSERITL